MSPSEAGLARGRGAVRLRLHLGRLRPRRTPRSVRRELPGHSTLEKLPKRGRERRLQLEGRARELRSPRAAPGVRAALPQQRRRHIHRREPSNPASAASRAVVPDDRGGRRLSTTTAGPTSTSPAIPRPACCSATSTTARSAEEGLERGVALSEDGMEQAGMGIGDRRLQPRRQPRHLQDALLRRHERPLPQRRQGLLRRRHDSRGPRRRRRATSAGAREWWISTTTACPTCSW